jgi:hypothetical protein
MFMKIARWVVIPALLIAAPFLISASSYERMAVFMVCTAAIVLVLRAVQMKEHSWTGGLVAVAVAFSPVSLLVKIFLVLTLACITSCFAVVRVFRMQPASVL